MRVTLKSGVVPGLRRSNTWFSVVSAYGACKSLKSCLEVMMSQLKGGAEKRGWDELEEPENKKVARPNPPMEILKEYRARMEELKATKQRKPDMVAYSEFRAKGMTMKRDFGHPKGATVGSIFRCKGELAVLGIHQNISKGIDSFEGSAYAIALSGGYMEDEDRGSTFIYSGEGGQEKNVQVRDQKWVGGNKALRRARQDGTPIRVVRAIDRGKLGKDYVYDGLYKVVRAYEEKHITTGKIICKFEFAAIEGESKTSTKVMFQTLYNAKKKLLFNAKKAKKSRDRGSRPEAKYGFMVGDEVIRGAEQMRHVKGNVIIEDVSKGSEQIRIPVVNDIDDEEFPSCFQYMKSLRVFSRKANGIAQTRVGKLNGCQALVSQYNCGLLTMTVPEGVRECPPSCGSSCAGNRVVQCGIRYPLEIFKTPTKGWGVRSSEMIPVGAFVCQYVGDIITDTEAEEAEDDSYLFDLNHFLLLRHIDKSGDTPLDIDMAKVPQIPFTEEQIKNEDFHDQYVVVNGLKRGNVGRFINHKCGSTANLVKQPVLCEDSNGIFYHLCFFAVEDIPPMTELHYDYGYKQGSAEDYRMKCECGSPHCKKYLL